MTDASDIAELAAQIQALRQQVNAGTLATRLTNSSVETPGGDTTVVIADTVDQAADTAATIPGLQEMLDSHEDAIAENRTAVDAATEAATQASADGIAAGELASAAADVALDNAATANAAAVDAKSRADAAKAAADAAGITAGSASSAAATAQAAAQAADTKAVNAQTAASNAATAAATAQSAASDANTAALNAAGIANGKGRVIYSTTAPTGADQNANNLWINLSGGANTPNQWNGSAWVAVTDKAATDAASAAATAKSAADAAKAVADAAQGTANGAASAASAAQTTANGKNQVTYSTATPTAAANPGTRAGDIWFVRNGNGWLSAQYEWSGSDWILRTLDSAIIAYLDAGKITAGTISADRIGANSITAAKLAADSVTSNAILAGTIQAVDIASGTITGDRIAAATLTASLIMADTLTSREIGADAILARNIKALQITATHIAASTITGDKIAANTITAGNIAAGSITANEIKAGSITATQINLDTLNGKMITGLTLQTAATGARATLGTVSVQLGGVASNVPSVRFYDANPDMEALDIRPAPSIPGGIVVGGRTVGLEGDSGIVVGNFFLAPLGVTIPSPAGEPTPFGNSTTFYTPTIVTRDIATYAVHDASSGRVLLDDTGWVNITPASGYAADSTLGWRVRRTGQTVELSGQATRTASGSIAAGGALGSLPAGFRPARTRHFMVPGSTSAWARVTVDSSGSIVVGAMNGTTQYLITDEIRFFIN